MRSGWFRAGTEITGRNGKTWIRADVAPGSNPEAPQAPESGIYAALPVELAVTRPGARGRPVIAGGGNALLPRGDPRPTDVRVPTLTRIGWRWGRFQPVPVREGPRTQPWHDRHFGRRTGTYRSAAPGGKGRPDGTNASRRGPPAVTASVARCCSVWTVVLDRRLAGG
jgi:hypothetical protein